MMLQMNIPRSYLFILRHPKDHKQEKAVSLYKSENWQRQSALKARLSVVCGLKNFFEGGGNEKI